MALFEKRPGAPSADFKVSVTNGTYLFSGSTPVTVTDPKDIQGLKENPYTRLVGGQEVALPIASSSQVISAPGGANDGDILSYKNGQATWTPNAGGSVTVKTQSAPGAFSKGTTTFFFGTSDPLQSGETPNENDVWISGYTAGVTQSQVDAKIATRAAVAHTHAMADVAGVTDGFARMQVLIDGIYNTQPPQNQDLPSISFAAPLNSGETVTAFPGIWYSGPDAGELKFSFQWKSGSTNVGTDDDTYATVAGDVGKVLTCQVTATNNNGSTVKTAIGSTVAPQALTARVTDDFSTVNGQFTLDGNSRRTRAIKTPSDKFWRKGNSSSSAVIPTYTNGRLCPDRDGRLVVYPDVVLPGATQKIEMDLVPKNDPISGIWQAGFGALIRATIFEQGAPGSVAESGYLAQFAFVSDQASTGNLTFYRLKAGSATPLVNGAFTVPRPVVDVATKLSIIADGPNISLTFGSTICNVTDSSTNAIATGPNGGLLWTSGSLNTNPGHGIHVDNFVLSA